IKAVRPAKLFVFLRLHRDELFDEEFQAELAGAYADRRKGQPPVPPAQLALATILQAYTGGSDDEGVEAMVMDRRRVEWTVALAGRTGGFEARALRAALDSSPLGGAGRVEDTINLMGHA